MLNKLKKLLNNQKGLGLLEVMIAGAMAIAISLSISKMTQTSNKSITKVKSDVELMNLQSFIKATINRGSNCRNTFDGHAPPGNPAYNMHSPGSADTDATTTPPIGTSAMVYDLIDTAGSTFSFSINTDSATQNTTNTLDLTIGQAVQGYSNWAPDEIRVYQIEPGTYDSGTGNGICQMRLKLKRVKSQGAKARSFGTEDMVMWMQFFCRINDGTGLMEFCSSNDRNTGFWTLKNDLAPLEGIKYILPVLVEDDLTVEGSLAITSDERLKRDEEVIANASDKLSQINGYYYFMRHDEFPNKRLSNERQLGVFAQEVESVFPEAVNSPASGFKSVRYNMLVPALIEAHKEQEDKIKRQEKRIQMLEEKLDFLLDKDNH